MECMGGYTMVVYGGRILWSVWGVYYGGVWGAYTMVVYGGRILWSVWGAYTMVVYGGYAIVVYGGRILWSVWKGVCYGGVWGIYETDSVTILTRDSVFVHTTQGTKYEVGDIVSMLDEGGQLYYALIRGFLEDQYAEKYAVLTWLVPTTPNPRSFDPSLFVLGEK